MNKIEKNLQCALEFLKDIEKKDYIGEPVSQLEHALQAAFFAEQSGHSEEVILASLFHDIGHFASHFKQFQMAELGIVHHEWIGAKLAYDVGFSKKIAWLIGNHVNAKRYLVSKKTHYYERLSKASKGTLDFQGGPMDANEIKNFEDHRFFKEILQVRINDEKAKNIELNVPKLDYYVPLIKKNLMETSTDSNFVLKDFVDKEWVMQLKNFLDN